jgi:hypothetical protein
VPPLNFRREDIPDLSTGETTDKLLRGLNGFGAEADKLLNGGLTFKANMKSFAKEIAFTAQDDWAAITPSSPWTAGTPAPYIRKRGKTVELRGALAINAAVSGSTAYVLATDYVPAPATHFQAVGGFGAYGVHLYQTGTSGVVYFNSGVTGVSLDGVSWDAADATGGVNGVFPLSIRNEIPGTPTPSHVWVTRSMDVTDSREVPVALGGVAWTVSKDQIVIRDIANVLPGRRYKVTILVAAE